MTVDERKIYITWEKKFELGIPVIDEQHKRLVQPCNHLYTEIVGQQTESRAGNLNWQIAFSSALRETVDYVQTHFRDEEKLLSAIGYPAFTQHKAQHQQFVAKITEMLSDFQHIESQDAINFLHFLYNWILEHIAVEDKQYVSAVIAYLKNRQNNG